MSTPAFSNPQTLGTVNGTPIVAELGGGLAPEALARVTMSQNYIMANLPGYPTRPPADNETSKRLWPTVPSGTTCYFLKPEAAALVAAASCYFLKPEAAALVAAGAAAYA